MGRDTEAVLAELRQFESQNVTFLDPDQSWPIVWERAKGEWVWDAEGRRYLDLTAAFGVAAAGHANSQVVRAGQRQMAKLLHAMGDVHPHALKARLAHKLSEITFERWSQSRATGQSAVVRGKTIFCNSGFEAVEAALKTSVLATGKPGVIAFRAGYHGLGYGALNATHRGHFRRPFLPQLAQFGEFVDFPSAAEDLPALETAIEQLIGRKAIGAIMVEPVQVRGGVHVPPAGFLLTLRRLCDDSGALLVLDEIYTGFGRTGSWFACEHWDVVPDLICLGKALTGGFPLSACVGKADVMDSAWPPSTGEAIHTSTFLGHPVGCAMALAQIEEIRTKRLPERAAVLGRELLGMLQSIPSTEQLQLEARGLGLAAGLELKLPTGAPATDRALQLVKSMLNEGFVLLPEGEHANVIGLTPPLTIQKRQLTRTLTALSDLLLNSRLGRPSRRDGHNVRANR